MSDKTSTVAALPVQHRGAALSADVFADPVAFEHFQRVAKVFASSNLVPQHLRGNVADCVIALAIARRLNEDPLTVFQSIYVVNGKPGWLTSYMIARVNRAGVFRSPITWDEAGSGDGLTVTAKAIIAGTGEEVKVSVDMRMAKAEGWTKNAKYTSMPSHMLRWRSAAMLIRLYCPEILMGMPVVDELETLPSMRDVTPQPASMKAALDQFANAEPANHATAETVGADRENMEARPTKDIGTGGLVSTHSASSQAAPTPQPGAPASGQPAPEISTPQQQSTGQAGAGTAPAEPKTAAAYIGASAVWIENLLDADAGLKRWKDEKSLRNKLNVDPDDRDRLDASLKAKVAALKIVLAAKAEGSKT